MQRGEARRHSGENWGVCVVVLAHSRACVRACMHGLDRESRARPPRVRACVHVCMHGCALVRLGRQSLARAGVRARVCASGEPELRERTP
jgi:hypothetical protein